VQWTLLEPLLLPRSGNTAGRGGRPEKHPRRRVLDAIFCPVRGGLAWRRFPAGFLPAKTVDRLFSRWTAVGAWAHPRRAARRARVRAGRALALTAAIIDSASVRGADTAPTRSRGYDTGRKVPGRTRHLAVHTGGRLLAVVVTVAGIQYGDGAVRLLAVLRATFGLVGADGGYAGRLVTWARTVLARTFTIVKRTDDLTGCRVIPRRWVGERTLAKISERRRCVPHCETLLRALLSGGLHGHDHDLSRRLADGTRQRLARMRGRTRPLRISEASWNDVSNEDLCDL
jgi:transposase